MQNFQNSHYQIFYSNSFDYDIRIKLSVELGEPVKNINVFITISIKYWD